MKNLTIFRSTAGWLPNILKFEENLSAPGKLGYSWRILREGLPYIWFGSDIFLTCEHQKKLIPASVVNTELKIRSEKIESEQGYRIGKKQKHDLKETILIELNEKAFVTSKLTNVWINLKEDLLCIETTSSAITDDIIHLLIRDLGFKGRRLETDKRPSVFMRSLMVEGVEREFERGSCCILKDVRGEKFITYKNEDLSTEKVINYVLEGRFPEKLEIEFNGGQAIFTLDKNLVISKIVIPDMEIDRDSYQTPEDYFDAEFTIRAGMCVEIINALINALGEKKLIEEKDAA